MATLGLIFCITGGIVGGVSYLIGFKHGYDQGELSGRVEAINRYTDYVINGVPFKAKES